MALTETILIRVPVGTKDRLKEHADKLNVEHPDANYTAHAIARVAILQRIEELDKE